MRSQGLVVAPFIAAGFAAAVGVAMPPQFRAQSPTASPRPAFEVASIKPNKSGDPRATMVPQPGGRFTATNVTLRMLIRNAYQLSNFEMSGGPTWIDADRFDVAAKAEGNASQEQIRFMLRTLLADRFGLRVHSETRELPVYALVMARNDRRFGSQLRRTQAECRNVPAPASGALFQDPLPACGFFGAGPGLKHLAFRGMTMEGVAGLLKPMVRRVVVDRTGLAGHFDGDFDFTTELGPPPPPPGMPDRYDRQSFSTIFTVIQEQLGLKLESARGPVEILVIDHAELPTED